MPFDLTALTHTGLEGLFYVLLLTFTIHALFLAYHWFTYGSNRRVSLIALATYLTGGAVLFLTYASALRLMYL